MSLPLPLSLDKPLPVEDTAAAAATTDLVAPLHAFFQVNTLAQEVHMCVPLLETDEEEEERHPDGQKPQKRCVYINGSKCIPGSPNVTLKQSDRIIIGTYAFRYVQPSWWRAAADARTLASQGRRNQPATTTPTIDVQSTKPTSVEHGMMLESLGRLQVEHAAFENLVTQRSETEALQLMPHIFDVKARMAALQSTIETQYPTADGEGKGGGGLSLSEALLYDFDFAMEEKRLGRSLAPQQPVAEDPEVDENSVTASRDTRADSLMAFLDVPQAANTVTTRDKRDSLSMI